MAMQALHLVICLLFAAILGEAGLTKLMGRSTPDWFTEKFASTWLAPIPAPLLWWPIAIAELAIAALFVAAIVKGESAASASQALTQGALVGASALFAALTMGLRLSQDFAGASAALTYFGVAALLAATMFR